MIPTRQPVGAFRVGGMAVMRQVRLVLVALVLALAAPTASSQVAPDQLIGPGERIGQIELTGNLAAVRAAFGPETVQLPSVFGEGATLYAWASRALEVQADNTTGNLLLIFIGIPDTPDDADFAFAFPSAEIAEPIYH